MDKTFATALIVEDHPLFGEALGLTLRHFIGIGAIEQAGTLAAGIEALGRGGVDVVLLDLHLPDVTGMEGLIRLLQAAGNVPVLVVSSLAEPRVVAAALAAGARGFVPKHAGRETFAAAFAALARGEVFALEGPVAGVGAAAAQDQDTTIARLRTLTRQQAAILQLICAGKPNKVIAYEMSVAETTVKAHVTAIMRKLGVTSRTQAVLLASGVNFAQLLEG
jgi:DNA-binding NarL/FixJ family response regulator